MKQWEQQTLSYYDQNFESFIAGSVHVDMTAVRDRFLACLPEQARILDLGCGSGRDTKIFLEKGYRVDAVDGSAALCRQASAYAGIPVRQLRFEELNRDGECSGTYDGIWACASLLHLPKAALQEVLPQVADMLKPDGVLYTCFKYGDFEGVENGRHFTYLTESSLEALWEKAFRGADGEAASGESSCRLDVFDTWYTQDGNPERKEVRWINILARRR